MVKIKKLPTKFNSRDQIIEKKFVNTNTFFETKESEEVTFIDCHFEEKFNYSDFSESRFLNCTFKKCIFTRCRFTDASFNNCKFDSCSFKQGAFNKMILSEVDFSNCTINDTNMSYININNCCFIKTKLQFVDFYSSSFVVTKFHENIEFRHCHFKQFTIVNCYFDGTKLIDCKELDSNQILNQKIRNIKIVYKNITTNLCNVDK